MSALPRNGHLQRTGSVLAKCSWRILLIVRGQLGHRTSTRP